METGFEVGFFAGADFAEGLEAVFFAGTAFAAGFVAAFATGLVVGFFAGTAFVAGFFADIGLCTLDFRRLADDKAAGFLGAGLEDMFAISFRLDFYFASGKAPRQSQ